MASNEASLAGSRSGDPRSSNNSSITGSPKNNNNSSSSSSSMKNNSSSSSSSEKKGYFASPHKQQKNNISESMIDILKETLHANYRYFIGVLRRIDSSAAAKLTNWVESDCCKYAKKDIARLAVSPLFWILAALFCVSAAAACVAAVLWVLAAPLLLPLCDFNTFCRSENENKFKGKVVWITGGSTGIGVALAMQLARRGVRGLILTSRSLSSLEAAKQSILIAAKQQKTSSSSSSSSSSSNGCCCTLKDTDILLLPFDLSKGFTNKQQQQQQQQQQEEDEETDDWQQLVDRAIQWKGGVDFLFNNAGRLAIGCFPSTETIVDVFGVNFFAAVQLTNLLLPHFKQKGSGHIVFTNSSSAYFGFGGFNAYATSKAALLSFTNLLRQDLRGNDYKEIFITSVHPGYIKTKIHSKMCDPLIQQKLQKDIQVQWQQKGPDVDEAAELIVRGVSRNEEEVWVAVAEGLLQMYLGYYMPGLLGLLRRYTAKKECMHSTKYRETVVTQLNDTNTTCSTTNSSSSSSSSNGGGNGEEERE